MSPGDVTNEQLAMLIFGLEDYERRGITDPWLLDDYSIIEPLDTLRALRDCRASREELIEALEALVELEATTIGGIPLRYVEDLKPKFERARAALVHARQEAPK